MEYFDGKFEITTEKAAIAVRETTRSDIIKGDNRYDLDTVLGFTVVDALPGTMTEEMHLQVRKADGDKG